MSGSKAKSRVLVVDDERLIADTLKEILELHGFDATSRYSGESALEWIETYRPDIVLTDIVMHKLDGIEAAVRIRALHPQCRVILFSASALSAANRRKINHLGFEYLQRPLHPNDLLARVTGNTGAGGESSFQSAQ
jgi:DNA-binding response OmpR family regulator